MNVILSDSYDIWEKLSKLSYEIPYGIALLPSNLETAEAKEDLIYENSTKAIRTLLNNNKITETPIEKEGASLKYRQQNAFEWLLPTIFISYSIFSENPHLLSITLNVISNYLTDLFKGVAGEKVVKLNLVIEVKKKGKFKKLEYRGTPEGLKELPKILKNM